jgi:DNA-binding CsgD family transcriptional regulator
VAIEAAHELAVMRMGARFGGADDVGAGPRESRRQAGAECGYARGGDVGTAHRGSIRRPVGVRADWSTLRDAEMSIGRGCAVVRARYERPRRRSAGRGGGSVRATRRLCDGGRCLSARRTGTCQSRHPDPGAGVSDSRTLAREPVGPSHTGDERDRQPAAHHRPEREIASLVAAGLTNREVANRLGLSVRTVDGHLYRIFAKLGIEDRDQLARLMRMRPAT